MNAKILIMGVAIAALAAGGASAGKAKHHSKGAGEKRSAHAMYAPPDQPIPYAQVDDYLKASPKERMAMAQQAPTGGAADASATAPAPAPAPAPSQPQ